MTLDDYILISKAFRASENLSWDKFYREHVKNYESPYTDEEIREAKKFIAEVNDLFDIGITIDTIKR